AGWAEQDPLTWWADTKEAIKKTHQSGLYNPKDIGAIGIAYQMHGLVVVDKMQKPLRNAIIWCDSRAVELGNNAYAELKKQNFLSACINPSGNFSATKRAWVKQEEQDLYAQIHKFMMPRAYLTMCLAGEKTATISSMP